MQLSQYTHGGTIASGLYRKNHGNSKQVGEHIYPETWSLPFTVSWYCITELGKTLVSKLGRTKNSLQKHFYAKASKTFQSLIQLRSLQPTSVLHLKTEH
jgi:hypothetical protein